MEVVEGGNRLYRMKLASIQTCIYKTEYSILGEDDHVQSIRPKVGQCMVTSCDTQVDQDFKCLCGLVCTGYCTVRYKCSAGHL